VEWNDDVLGKDISREILATLKPSLVFSAHVHRPCVALRRASHMTDERWQEKEEEEERVQTAGVVEVTLPTFAWRMRPDSGYAIA
jgi:hypothetical protein